MLRSLQLAGTGQAQLTSPLRGRRCPGVSNQPCTSGRDGRTPTTCRLFGAGTFDAKALSCEYMGGVNPRGPSPLHSPRYYTCTHNDFNGAVNLTIGASVNEAQFGDWYRRLLRDEVVGYWLSHTGRPSLHLYCHVSGQERWLAPPILRDYLFRQEMPLVLEAILYADAELFRAEPELLETPVFVHFDSDVHSLKDSVFWGTLGDRATWPQSKALSLEALLFGASPRSMQPFKNGSAVSSVAEALLSISQVFSPARALEGVEGVELSRRAAAVEAIESMSSWDDEDDPPGGAARGADRAAVGEGEAAGHEEGQIGEAGGGEAGAASGDDGAEGRSRKGEEAPQLEARREVLPAVAAKGRQAQRVRRGGLHPHRWPAGDRPPVMAVSP